MRIPPPQAGSQSEPFVFGIPLIARASVRDWGRVDALLELTLRSVLAQADGDYRVLLAAHEEPPCWARLVGDDQRFRILEADWPPEAPTSRNDDGGCKKWLIREEVRRGGGGLLMYLDADDLVDAALVSTARRNIGRRHLGAILQFGIALDFATLRAVQLPHPRVFHIAFHEICGSSTVGRVQPDSPDPTSRFAHDTLGSHHQWEQSAAAAGVELARLPAWGAYLVNTSENHSELYGPHAEWRHTLNRAVAEAGEPLSPGLAARFGLDLELISASSNRFARGLTHQA